MSRIDGREFARGQGRLSGRLLAHDAPRLSELGWRVAAVEFTLQGRTDVHGRCYLDLEAVGALTTTCQRCMQALEHPLRLARELELADSVAVIEQADDDVDRVLAGPAMAVNELVEDEVILELPMVGRHEQCEVMAGGDGEDAAGRGEGATAPLKDMLQEWAHRAGRDTSEPQTARRAAGAVRKPIKEQ
jgi:uncharacterized protein